MRDLPVSHRCAPWLRVLGLSAALAAVAGTGGCASAPRAAPADDGLDHEKMNQIERAARTNGVNVHWVNPPRRRS